MSHNGKSGVTIREFIQIEVLLPRIQRNGVLVLYDRERFLKLPVFLNSPQKIKIEFQTYTALIGPFHDFRITGGNSAKLFRSAQFIVCALTDSLLDAFGSIFMNNAGWPYHSLCRPLGKIRT